MWWSGGSGDSEYCSGGVGTLTATAMGKTRDDGTEKLIELHP